MPDSNRPDRSAWRAARLDFLYVEVERLSVALSDVGVCASISVDGVSSAIDRAGTLQLIDRYRREIASLEGRDAPMKTFDISGTWR